MHSNVRQDGEGVNNNRIPVWIDCDPGNTNGVFLYSNQILILGHDDAFALMLGGHNSKLEIIGISTVAGWHHARAHAYAHAYAHA